MSDLIKAVLIFCGTILIVAYIFKLSRYEVISSSGSSFLLDRQSGQTWRSFNGDWKIMER